MAIWATRVDVDVLLTATEIFIDKLDDPTVVFLLSYSEANLFLLSLEIRPTLPQVGNRKQFK